MSKLIHLRPTPAFVLALAAVFVALGSGAYAVTKAPKNSVVSKSIKNGQVKTPDLRNGAVRSAKVAPGAIKTDHIADGAITGDQLSGSSVGSAHIVGGAVNSGHIAATAVGFGHIGNSAVGTAKLANGAVESSKLANGAVTATKLGTIVEQMTSAAVGANSSAQQTAFCPAGAVAIGGGGGFVENGAGLAVTSSYRNIVGTGWVVRARNGTGSAQTLEAKVNCLQQ